MSVIYEDINQDTPIYDGNLNTSEENFFIPTSASMKFEFFDRDHMMGKHLVQAIKKNKEMLHLCTRGLKSCENFIGCGVTTFQEHICLYSVQRARYKNIEKIVVTITGVKEFEIDEELRKFFGFEGEKLSVTMRTTYSSYKKEISFFVKG